MKINIKELIVDEEGCFAISLVDDPAIEIDFQFFNREDFGRKGTTKPDGDLLYDNFGNPLWYKYEVPVPHLESESREFCKRRENKVYFISEIRSWAGFTQDYQGAAFIETQYVNYFNTFDRIQNYNLDQAMYNCRHSLVAIKDPDEIPQSKKNTWRKTILDQKAAGFRFKSEVNFSISNEEQRIIKGPALIPSKLIYRKDVGNGNPGYVYFSKETIKEIKERFGINHSTTFEHSYDITGSLEMLESYITPDEGIFDNTPDGSWIVSYKVLDNKLWDYIKKNGSLGYSIEAYLKPKY